jgi:hypothetical protein
MALTFRGHCREYVGNQTHAANQPKTTATTLFVDHRLDLHSIFLGHVAEGDLSPETDS